MEDPIVERARARAHFLNTVGTTIRDLRSRAGLSIDDVAEQTGIELGTLRDLETGAHDLTVSELQKLARAFGHHRPSSIMEIVEWRLQR